MHIIRQTENLISSVTWWYECVNTHKYMRTSTHTSTHSCVPGAGPGFRNMSCNFCAPLALGANVEIEFPACLRVTWSENDTMTPRKDQTKCHPSTSTSLKTPADDIHHGPRLQHAQPCRTEIVVSGKFRQPIIDSRTPTHRATDTTIHYSIRCVVSWFQALTHSLWPYHNRFPFENNTATYIFSADVGRDVISLNRPKRVARIRSASLRH